MASRNWRSSRRRATNAASAILNRAAPGSRTPAGEEIRQMDGRQLVNIVKSEQPQTIAFILACMEPPKAAELVQMLAPEMREEVIERLGAMEPTSRDSINKVAQNLARHFDRKSAQQGMQRSGGVQACADILNALDKVTRKEVLSTIEQKNATLGAAIRRKVFSFDDLSRLDPSDLGRVVREIDTAVITIALKGAKPALIQGVTSSMSKRAAEALMEEIEMLPQQRAKDVEAAQDKIIQVVRRLEEAERNHPRCLRLRRTCRHISHSVFPAGEGGLLRGNEVRAALHPRRHRSRAPRGLPPRRGGNVAHPRTPTPGAARGTRAFAVGHLRRADDAARGDVRPAPRRAPRADHGGRGAHPRRRAVGSRGRHSDRG